MTRHLRLSLVTVVIAGGMACLPFAGAFASPETSKAAMTDVEAARSALKSGNTQRAVDQVERAETTLLNAKQAGDETAPKALDDLKDAHQGLIEKNKTGARDALDKAAKDLRS
jgi:hypothetical protein